MLTVVCSEELFEKGSIDLAPVHQALHIYENLSITDKFARLYSESRQTQAAQAVEFVASDRIDFLKVRALMRSRLCETKPSWVCRRFQSISLTWQGSSSSRTRCSSLLITSCPVLASSHSGKLRSAR